MVFRNGGNPAQPSPGIRGGLPAVRVDQRYQPLPPGAAPGPQSPVFIGRLVVVFGSGEVGFFEYSGTPAGPVPGPANPPIAWAVPPSVTKDPFGNTLPASGGFATENLAASTIAQLFNAGLIVGTAAQFAGTGGAVTARVGLDATNDPGSLNLQSGAASGTDAQAFWLLASDTAAGGAGKNQVRTSSSVVLLANTTPPQLSGAALFGDSSGLPRCVPGTGTAGDTTAYGMVRKSFALVSNQTINSTSQVVIGSSGASNVQWQTNVGIGTYRFAGEIVITEGGTTGTNAWRLGGTATFTAAPTQLLCDQVQIQGPATASTVVVTDAAPGSDLGNTGMTNGTVQSWRIRGTIVVSAAGTMNFAARIITAATSYVIQAGSFLDVWPQ